MKARVGFCAAMVMFVLLFSSCTSGTLEKTNELNKPLPLNKTKITVGSKSMTEQYLLLKMTSLVLREHGYSDAEVAALVEKKVVAGA